MKEFDVGYWGGSGGVYDIGKRNIRGNELCGLMWQECLQGKLNMKTVYYPDMKCLLDVAEKIWPMGLQS